MAQPLENPIALDHEFTVPLGVDVKGEMWSCVRIPDSATIFGSLKSFRVDARIDEVALDNVGLMPTGSGDLMISVSAALRKRLGKELGDEVRVRLLRRLT